MRAGVVLFLLLLIFVGCKDVQINPVKGLRKIASGISIGTHTQVEMWTLSKPSVGYTPVTFIFKDAMHLYNVEVSHLVVRPRSPTGQGIPMEEPAKIEHWYEGSFTFPEPSIGSRWYEMEIEFQREGEMGVITFKPEVVEPRKPRLIWFTHNEEDYCAAIHFPTHIKTGLNSVELIIYKKEADSYSLAKDFSLTVDSRASTGVKPPHNYEVNLKPSNGHYNTTVNFVTGGDWQLNFKISATGNPVAHAPFDIHF